MTPLGLDVAAFWRALSGGDVAVKQSETLGGSERFVARVAESLGEPSDGGTHHRVIDFATRAVREAVTSVGRSANQTQHAAFARDLRNAALVVGTSAGVRTPWDLSAGAVFEPQLTIDGLDLFHGIATTVGDRTGIFGPSVTVNTACSSSASAISIAASWLEAGEVELAVVCGAEEFTEFSAVGFEAMGAYSPDGCAPFARSDGLSLGEGAGAVVLCRSDVATKYGTFASELVGSALSCDAYHATAPHPTGEGLERAISSALTQAGLTTDDVSYVNVHGTGTRLNDAAELALCERLFANSQTVINAIKGSIGHGLGAAGVLEFIATVMAVSDGHSPPSSNRADLSTESIFRPPLTMAALECVPLRPGVGVTINSAFGGHNAALVVRNASSYSASRGRPDDFAPGIRRRPRAMAVRGVGCAGYAGLGCEAWSNRTWPVTGWPETGLFATPSELTASPVAGVPFAEWRRLDRLTQLSLYAVVEALADAGYAGRRLDQWALILSTERGPVDSYAQLHAAVLAGKRVSPALFPRLVITACVGSIAEALHITGPVLTVTAGQAGTLAAILLAAKLLDEVEGVIVIGADAVSPFLIDPINGDAPSRWRAIGECAAAAVLDDHAAYPKAAHIDGLLLRRWSQFRPWDACDDEVLWAEVARSTDWERGDTAYAAVSSHGLDVKKIERCSELSAPLVLHERLPNIGAATAMMPLVDRHRETGTAAVLIADDLGSLGGYRIQ